MPPQVAPSSLAPVALRNAVASVLGRISGVVAGIVLTPFVLHHLGRDLYGVAVAVGSAFEYMSLLRGGMGGALRRYVTLFHHSGRKEDARRYYAAGFWWAGLLRGIILLVGLPLAGAFCRFLRLPTDLLSDATMGVALILVAAVVGDTGTMLEVPIYATGRTAGLTTLRTAMGWVRLGVMVLAFSFLAPNLRTFGGSLVIIEFLPLLFLIWMSRRLDVVGSPLPRPQIGAADVRRDLFRYGGLAVLSQAAALLYISTDNILIGRIYGAGAVTHYSLGTRWFPLIGGFLLAFIGSLTPLFTSLEAHGESKRSSEALCRVVAITSALAVPFCLVPCILGDLFLVHWVGPEYGGSAQYLIAMLVPLVLDAALSPVWMVLTARGRIGWIATSDIVVALGNVGLSLFLALVLKLGLLGFALGNTGALLVRGLILRPRASRRDPSMPPAREYLRPLPRALLGGAPALVLLYLLRGAYGGSLALVIVAGCLGGLLCLAGSALSAVGVVEIRRLLKLLLEMAGRRGA